MKRLFTIILSLIWISAFTQVKDYYEPPSKKECKPIKETSDVVKDRIIFVQSETSKQDLLNYCQVDSIRFVYSDSCLIAKFIKNGILNPNVLMKTGFHIYYSEDLINESYIYKILTEKGTNENWLGYYLFFGIDEVENLRTDKHRVLKLTSCSDHGDEKNIIYLELENLSATSKTTLTEFIENAQISCFLYWYTIF